MVYYNNESIVSTLKKAKDAFDSKLYRVSVPVIATMSEQELNMYGMYISGIKERDKTSSTEMVTVMIPTKSILEYFKQGATIRLLDSNDIKDIYLTIQDYLTSWKSMLENGINLIEAPSAELLELDDLATDVFSRAKFYFKNGDVENIIARHFSEINRINTNNFFEASVSKVIANSSNSYVTTDSNGNTIINSIDNPVVEDRESLSDFFKKRIYNTKFHRD